MRFGNLSSPVWIVSVICSGLVSLAANALEPPRELLEAEAKYSKAIQSHLENSSSELDTRKKLSELNNSFLNHLRKISPELLARNSEYGPMLTERIEILKWKISHSSEVSELDARKAFQDLRGKKEEAETVTKIENLDAPTGELECREEGEEVKVGEAFEIKGKTKSIPDTHVVQVFAVPNWKGLFPRENRKTPNRRFTVSETPTEVWAGQMEFHLMALPEKVMNEIDLYKVARQRWEAGGFTKDSVPVFNGMPTRNIYLDTLEKMGGLRLDTIKLTYVK